MAQKPQDTAETSEQAIIKIMDSISQETFAGSIEKESSPNVEIKSKQDKFHVKSRDADITLQFLEEHDSETAEITPEQEKKLKWKVMVIVLFITTMTQFILFADKISLSYATITDLFEDVGLTQNTYNNSSTLFYVGYLIGQANLILVQKFPIRHCMIGITLSWCVIIFLSCTVTNHKGIYATRFFLGFVESVTTSILNTTMGQFFTREEKAATTPIFATATLGVTIPIGLIAYGIMHVESNVPIWKLFFIIIGGMSFIWFLVVCYIYPSNPTDARFLTIEEKVWVIRRVQKSTGSSIEQKVIKKHQIIEALKDPISWLFFGFFICQMLANNLAYQQNLLYTGMGGISDLDSTLVSVASGGFSVICSCLTSIYMFYFENCTALAVIFWSIPSFAGSIAAATIPWDHKIALIGMISLAGSLYGIPWMLMISWNSTTCSGYTKVLTRNGMIMFGYGIANLISPQLWQEKDAPRFIPAWIVQIVLSFFVAPACAGVIWYLLKKRNTDRSMTLDSDSKNGIVIQDDGQEVKVSLGALDLTDLENERFIYPL